jgi:hypothetical protein
MKIRKSSGGMPEKNVSPRCAFFPLQTSESFVLYTIKESKKKQNAVDIMIPYNQSRQKNHREYCRRKTKENGGM